MSATFKFEKRLWKKYKFVAGADEVGRGCFAGAVVAGCVIFQEGISIPEDIIINDSKKLRPRQREKSSVWIKKNALSWGIGEAPASLINRIGMSKATKIAFRRAIADARKKRSMVIDFLIIDAFFVPYVSGLPTSRRQLAIIDGDEKSYSVSAASIIAKVHRDKIMTSLAKQSRFKKYGWGRNKGYGTREHQGAIKKYGLTRYHRKVFVQTFLNSNQ